MRRRDLTGQTFGKLTVREYAGSTTRGEARWLCDCECGGQKVIRGRDLVVGDTKSCGCLVASSRPARYSRNKDTYLAETQTAVRRRYLEESGVPLCALEYARRAW